ncbi:hypothetical protein [Nocardia vinacea]|uniref:hypothetical protein n=1 Tax=Nocardia vinacea TaxID=96468 RepID=UPI000593CFF1|nr:hypothetical protein [Nocardia vinacea]
MNHPVTQACPAWCHEHINPEEPDEGTSHRGQDVEVVLEQHGPVSVFVERYDDQSGDSKYSVFLYPKDGLVQLSLDEARELNSVLALRIAQADSDRRA